MIKKRLHKEIPEIKGDRYTLIEKIDGEPIYIGSINRMGIPTIFYATNIGIYLSGDIETCGYRGLKEWDDKYSKDLLDSLKFGYALYGEWCSERKGGKYKHDLFIYGYCQVVTPSIIDMKEIAVDYKYDFSKGGLKNAFIKPTELLKIKRPYIYSMDSLPNDIGLKTMLDEIYKKEGYMSSGFLIQSPNGLFKKQFKLINKTLRDKDE